MAGKAGFGVVWYGDARFGKVRQAWFGADGLVPARCVWSGEFCQIMAGTAPINHQ